MYVIEPVYRVESIPQIVNSPPPDVASALGLIQKAKTDSAQLDKAKIWSKGWGMLSVEMESQANPRSPSAGPEIPVPLVTHAKPCDLFVQRFVLASKQTTSVLTVPDIPVLSDESPYWIDQDSDDAEQVDDALQVNLSRLPHSDVEQLEHGTQRLEDPVSKSIVKFWGGVPMLMGPVYNIPESWSVRTSSATTAVALIPNFLWTRATTFLWWYIPFVKLRPP